ncbi:hypothetical protein G9U51_13600 [Calidifontibacter sp. DB0510]|uniref:Uncharacterized protein n=1 Tax=Metallococcus carri TaxID=1656884 RepID=A0A967EBD1_9MICO|nr:hypothetical protein [Metallococcus carri]NHN56809.1 hypothetical protein [Metallococcus carri]NOP37814.1 hypothetical protein [Calidifontibacter sp. DB2511S]
MDALELTVDSGRPVTSAGRFFQLGHDLLALLDELSETPLDWRITRVWTGSVGVAVAPPEDKADEVRVLRLVVAGLGLANSGERPSADEWSPDAVKAAHRFVEDGRAADNEADWVPPQLALVSDKPRLRSVVQLTPGLSENLQRMQPFERKMFGAVRGELVGLNVSRGNRASLRLPNRRIVRVGFDTVLRDDLKNALYAQVELSGEVKQDDDGRVFHIKADALRTLVKADVRWDQLYGADPDFIAGVPVDEWLKVHRGDA